MPDIHNVRARSGVRIYLHPADIADIVIQQDVFSNFTDEELEKIVFVITKEIERRKQQ